jgi:hypothetical protein
VHELRRHLARAGAASVQQPGGTLVGKRALVQGISSSTAARTSGCVNVVEAWSANTSARTRPAAAGGVVAGAGGHVIAVDQLRPWRLAQRLRVQLDGQRIADDLADQVRVGVPLERARRRPRSRAEVEAAHEVAQPAQRRLVTPLQIVDHQQQRALLGEIDRQPVRARLTSRSRPGDG